MPDPVHAPRIAAQGDRGSGGTLARAGAGTLESVDRGCAIARVPLGREGDPTAMTTDSITLRVPHPLYSRLEERARQTSRSVEEAFVETLAEAVSLADEPLPAAAADLRAPLGAMSDDALRHLARCSHLSPAAALLGELNRKGQREGLAEEERRVVAALGDLYERALLLRSGALATLAARGQDTTALLGPAA